MEQTLKCPECRNDTTRVQDSRPIKDNTSVRRRRLCSHCKLKFLTKKIILINLPMVIKKDRKREPFSRAKVEKSLYTSCQKRPISKQRINSLVTDLLKKISQRGSPELNSDIIRRYVMAELKKLGEVAYVCFASAYMTFKEVNNFSASIRSNIV